VGLGWGHRGNGDTIREAQALLRDAHNTETVTTSCPQGSQHCWSQAEAQFCQENLGTKA